MVNNANVDEAFHVFSCNVAGHSNQLATQCSQRMTLQPHLTPDTCLSISPPRHHPQGRALVADFGIAKARGRTALSTRNVHAGTPAYMVRIHGCWW